MEIGSTLKSLRNIYGYSGKELSKKIEISPGYLSEIENNKKKPSINTLEKYAKVFDLKLSTLILLAEEDLGELGKGESWIRKKMISFLEKRSRGELS